MANSSVAITVDPALEIPPYRQIIEQVRSAIQRGELAPNAALPTVRQLAGDLNVAPNTVARAYADLQSENWLTSNGRRGTRVAPRIPTNNKRVRTGLLRDHIGDFIKSLLGRGYSRDEISQELERSLDSGL